MHDWLAGWLAGWLHGWMDGLMDGWMDGWAGWAGWIDGWMDGWMDVDVHSIHNEYIEYIYIQQSRLMFLCVCLGLSRSRKVMEQPSKTSTEELHECEFMPRRGTPTH